MPIYLYQHPKTNKIVEVFQAMNDIHEYEENGVKFKRVLTVPNAAFNSIPLDPYSAKDFSRVTNKGGSLGDLFDRSAELSEKRIQKDGVDTLQESFYEDYKTKHKGTDHPERKRAKTKKAADDLGLKVTFGD